MNSRLLIDRIAFGSPTSQGRIKPVAELDALVGFRGPGRARGHLRDHLRRLAISVKVFIIESRKRPAGRCRSPGIGHDD